MVPVGVLCEGLHLHPPEFGHTLTDVDTGENIEIVYPWSGHPQSSGEDMSTFDDPQDCDDPSDPFAWHESVNAFFLFPLHNWQPNRLAVRLRGSHYVPGTPLVLGDSVPAVSVEPPPGVHIPVSSAPSSLGLCPRLARPIDTTCTPPADVVEDLPEAAEHATPASPVPDLHEGPSPAIQTRSPDPDDAVVDLTQPTCLSDSDAPTTPWFEEAVDFFDTRFPDSTYDEAHDYLRWGFIPGRYQGKDMYKQRKAWTQNVRRRFKIRRSKKDPEERELFSIPRKKTKKEVASAAPKAWLRAELKGLRRVPRRREIQGIVERDHQAHHDGHNAAEYRLGAKYRIPRLREHVQRVCGENCILCASYASVKQRPTEAILTSRPLQLVMFDLTKAEVPTKDGKQWILTTIDHFTKYTWAKVFETKDAPPIADYLANLFTEHCGVPERWHADNGGEFVNEHIDAVRELLASRNHTNVENMINRLPYSHGLPYNPRCQGLVERMNQTLKKKIGKKMRQAGFQAGEDVDWDWEDLMKEAVHDINRSEIPLYGTSPYVMRFGRAPEAVDHEGLSAPALKRLHRSEHRPHFISLALSLTSRPMHACMHAL